MEELIKDMIQKVDAFHTKMGIPTGQISSSRFDHLQEELDEIREAYDKASATGVVDGLIDLVYVALGALLQMGVHPEYPFNEVHRANMAKVPKKTERHEHDAVKPEGWVPPDFTKMLEEAEVLRNVSPVYVDLTRLRMHKGNNYNRGTVTRDDHFPFGDMSYLPIIWMKICRVRSLTEVPGDTEEKRAESRRLVRRELSDIIVYSCFWEEAMRGMQL